MNSMNNQDQKTFTDFLRRTFKGVLEAIARFLNKLGIRPNFVTAFGLAGNIAAGVLIATGHLVLGGLVAMIIGPLDALDGTMARLRGESGAYGAFVDSVTDRFSEIALYGGLLVYSLDGSIQNVLLIFFATVGSLMVSYVRARAESLSFSAKMGLLSRAERYLILIPGIIFGYLRISLWILAVMTNFTAIQRFWHVRRQAKE